MARRLLQKNVYNVVFFPVSATVMLTVIVSIKPLMTALLMLHTSTPAQVQYIEKMLSVMQVLLRQHT